jgi:hypothetical protein
MTAATYAESFGNRWRRRNVTAAKGGPTEAQDRKLAGFLLLQDLDRVKISVTHLKEIIKIYLLAYNSRNRDVIPRVIKARFKISFLHSRTHP